MSIQSRDKIEFLVLLLTLAAVFYLGSIFHIDNQAIQGYLAKFPPPLVGFLYILLYVVVTFFIWFSKDFFRIAGALLFGASLSTLYIFIAESINAAILFHFARTLGRRFVEGTLKGRYTDLDNKIGRVNFLWLFLFRTVPLVPFRFLDMATGLTGISFKRYFAAVVLGSPIRIFWLQFILAAVGNSIFNPQVVSEYLLANRHVFYLSFIYVILIFVVGIKLGRRKKP